MKKTVKVIALILVLLLAAAAAGILVLWHNELASVASFRRFVLATTRTWTARYMR